MIEFNLTQIKDKWNLVIFKDNQLIKAYTFSSFNDAYNAMRLAYDSI